MRSAQVAVYSAGINDIHALYNHTALSCCNNVLAGQSGSELQINIASYSYYFHKIILEVA